MINQLYYEQGWFFLLLIIPAIILLYRYYLRYKHSTLTITTIRGLRYKKISSFITPPVLLLSIRLLTIFFIIMSLANIRLTRTTNYKKFIGEADIILALDVSKSMLIEDIKPNRLEALKNVISDFIAARTSDRIGIVLYAGESLYWCPLTKDYPFLLKKLSQINENDFLDGTAIGVGLASAVNALLESKSKNKIIILLTDGENNAGYIDPLTAAQIAEKFKIKVYTIGIGKNGIASFPVIDMNGNKTYVPIPVSIDENILKKIAASTGGIYFNARNSKGLQNTYNAIDKLEKNKVQIIKQVKYVDQFGICASFALFLLLLEIGLRYTLLRTWPK